MKFLLNFVLLFAAVGLLAAAAVEPIDSENSKVPQDEQAVVIEDCHLPKEIGRCFALFYRYAYNVETQKCEEFVYGGCMGNKNNFETMEACEKECLPAKMESGADDLEKKSEDATEKNDDGDKKVKRSDDKKDEDSKTSAEIENKTTDKTPKSNDSEGEEASKSSDDKIDDSKKKVKRSDDKRDDEIQTSTESERRVADETAKVDNSQAKESKKETVKKLPKTVSENSHESTKNEKPRTKDGDDEE